MEKKRCYMLDIIRGICIILVVVYHIFYDLTAIFDVNIPIFNAGIIDFLKYFFITLIIVISGISSNFSRSNLKRGLKILPFAIVITLVTYFFMPSELIIFGILHFFAFAMILYALVEKLVSYIPTVLGLVITGLLYIFTLNLYDNVKGVPNSFLLYLLGFNTGHTSADYFPLMPWFFAFLFGAILGRYFKENKAPEIFYKNTIPPLAFIGRHTLVIYILHQPIVYGVLWLIFEFLK